MESFLDVKTQKIIVWAFLILLVLKWKDVFHGLAYVSSETLSVSRSLFCRSLKKQLENHSVVLSNNSIFSQLGSLYVVFGYFFLTSESSCV